MRWLQILWDRLRGHEHFITEDGRRRRVTRREFFAQSGGDGDDD